MTDLLSLPSNEFAALLQWPKDYADVIRLKVYHSFYIKKRHGGYRFINSPGKKLKFIQKTIADIFMPLYMKNLPSSVHGYIPGDYPDKGVRHILSNARTHLGSSFLLNLDIDNFFGSIDSLKVMAGLRGLCPGIHQQTMETIVHACTYNNQLPMGAPSSPVVSNIISLPMDIHLEETSARMNIVYSRYVDDMSFSGPFSFEGSMEEEIAEVIRDHGFLINSKKRRHFNIEDVKLITGLVLHDGKVSVQQELIDNISSCITEYGRVKWLSRYMLIADPELKLKAKFMKQSIRGQLAFMEQITGGDETTQKLTEALNSEIASSKPSFDFYI